jgi:hypothetical protein
MSTSVANLAEIGSQPLGGPLITLEATTGILLSNAEFKESGLIELLRCKNGFYAFEGALHVLPSSSTAREYGLMKWNASDLWRADYQGLADRCFFFAEDVFGTQFCLHNDCVMSFDPETGEKEFIASDVDEWASRILDGYDLLTGHRMAHEWQIRHGVIPIGERLIPKVPFVLGGAFAVDNLFPLEAAKSMRSRANLAVQIKTLPDGSEIEFELVE